MASLVLLAAVLTKASSASISCVLSERVAQAICPASSSSGCAGTIVTGGRLAATNRSFSARRLSW
mgnify:CR=1 FL=1